MIIQDHESVLSVPRAVPELSRLTTKSANINTGIAARQRFAADEVTDFGLLIGICFFIVNWMILA